MRPLSAATEAAPVTTDVTSEPGSTGARRQAGEIVDWTVIEQLRTFSTDEMDLVRELVASFEANVTQQLPELEQAVRRDDAETAGSSRIACVGAAGTLARGAWNSCASGSNNWAAPASRLARWSSSTTCGRNSRACARHEALIPTRVTKIS